MRQLWVGVVVISMTACSAADLRRNLEPRTIDEATGPPALLAERGTVPGAIPTEATSYINVSYTYYGLIKSSAESPGDNRLAAMLALSGMQQVDALCDEWFRRLALAQAELKATDDLVTAGGTLTAGILALANATNAAVGAVALATGFAHSLLTTAQVNFIVAPDVAVVAQANSSLRAAEQACVSTYARAGVLDNFRARKFIAEYAQMCTPVAVKELINQSIAARSITTTPTSTGFCTSAGTIGGPNILTSVVQPPPPLSAKQPVNPAILPAVVPPSKPIPLASVTPPDNADAAALRSAATSMSQVFAVTSPLTDVQVAAAFAVVQQAARLSASQQLKLHQILQAGGLENATDHHLNLRPGKTTADLIPIFSGGNVNGALQREVDRLLAGT
jgi:hypothetical protein